MGTRAVRRVPVADDMWRPLGLIAMDDVLRTVGREVDVLADTVTNQTAP